MFLTTGSVAVQIVALHKHNAKTQILLTNVVLTSAHCKYLQLVVDTEILKMMTDEDVKASSLYLKDMRYDERLPRIVHGYGCSPKCRS